MVSQEAKKGCYAAFLLHKSYRNTKPKKKAFCSKLYVYSQISHLADWLVFVHPTCLLDKLFFFNWFSSAFVIIKPENRSAS